MTHRALFGALALCAAVSVLAVACATSSNGSSSPDPDVKGATFSGPMDEPLTREYRACSNDAECVLAQNGCCDCVNGGADIAVNRDRAAAFKERFRCTSGCTEMGGECGRGTIACEANLCVYRDAAP